MLPMLDATDQVLAEHLIRQGLPSADVLFERDDTDTMPEWGCEPVQARGTLLYRRLRYAFAFRYRDGMARIDLYDIVGGWDYDKTLFTGSARITGIDPGAFATSGEMTDAFVRAFAAIATVDPVKNPSHAQVLARAVARHYLDTVRQEKRRNRKGERKFLRSVPHQEALADIWAEWESDFAEK